MQNIDKKKLTPMMKQYFEIKERYEGYILFYRLGDFYEMFFDDAIKASKALEITLTARNCGLEEKAPLCGVPHHAANTYLTKLIDKGFKVAICEQVEDPKTAKGIVKRDVVRVITPGTVIDASMLSEDENNYVLSIYEGEHNFGLSYSDITTGELKSTIIKKEKNYSKLLDEINKISPTEIISSLQDETILSNTLLQEDFVLSTVPASYFKLANAESTIKRLLNVFSSDSLGFDNQEEMILATGAILSYIEDPQKVELSHISTIDIYSIDSFMILDKFTRRNLELVETMRSKEKRGSLLWVLDKTKTSMGTRELKRMIEQPLLNVNLINKRLNAVESMYDDLFLRDEIRTLLSDVYDLERLSTKLVYGNVNARDLLALKSSLTTLPIIRNLLRDFDTGLLCSIRDQIDPLEDICENISNSINEDPPISIKDGNIINDGYSSELDELRSAVKNGKTWIYDIEQREKDVTGIRTLKIGFNKVFGYYIEVTRANSAMVPESYIRKQTLANAERYITPELKEIEEKVLGAEDKIVALEYKLFCDIRVDLLKNVSRLLSTAKQISLLYVICSFADVSYNNNYVKPNVNDSKIINIVKGRHPVIEKISLEEKFVPNSTTLDDDTNKMYIITGPNMAGKSTYLRQVALITLMAQLGCYVPCEEALIGIVDRIFTRVGASDDLSQGQSTFMVEMSELANILHNSTSNSLIILDEIGRGTSTYDGLSIAWAVVEYLSQDKDFSPKTMFATHYHELTELEGKFEAVKNYRISVEEVGDDIVFLRKIVRGSANQSYGIQVAKLAGIPDKVLKIAYSVLKKLEEHDINNNINSILNDSSSSSVADDTSTMNTSRNSSNVVDSLKVAESSVESSNAESNNAYSELELENTVKSSMENTSLQATLDFPVETEADKKEETNQISFFEASRYDDIIEELKSLNVLEMTPMDSMTKLFELVKKVK
ncbi:MAG: DNA mismatch repair protein MutS [Acidaminobacteraceae bacterium]